MNKRMKFIAWRRDLGAPARPAGFNENSRAVEKVTYGLLNLYRKCNPPSSLPRSTPPRCLTKPREPAHNNGFDNCFHDYILFVHDTLSDDEGNQFVVLDLLGTGTFGQVVKCRLQNTGEIVAVKVIKNQPAYFNQAWVEINILRMLHRNNADEDTQHIVRIFNHFIFRGHLCLVFEKLGVNLYELLRQNNYVGVDLETLRSILLQLLKALDVLVQSEVIHCDLKPENILLSSTEADEVKIIDFGSACQLHYPVYSYVQSRFYRSPEVLLGANGYGSQIDMWSLGCVAGELFLGIPLFPGQNEMNMISRIAEMLGDMPDRFLRRCRGTSKFFNSPGIAGYGSEGMHVFRLKTVSQYEQENHVTLPPWRRFFKEKKLKDIVSTFAHPKRPLDIQEVAFRECFVDLLHGMLRVDPSERWTPAEALEHPFIRGQTLPSSQPWCPPARQMRVVRSKPVFIQQSNAEQRTPVDEFYSASAPNFTSTGHLIMNTTWGTGAGGKPAIVGKSNGMFQFQQQDQHCPPRPYELSENRYREERREGVDSAFLEKKRFGPSSYVPSSSRYGSNSKTRQRSFIGRRGSSNLNVGSSLVGSQTLASREPGLLRFRDNHTCVSQKESDIPSKPQAEPFRPGYGSRGNESGDLPINPSTTSKMAIANPEVSQKEVDDMHELLPFRSDDKLYSTPFQGSRVTSGAYSYVPLPHNPVDANLLRRDSNSRSRLSGALLPPPHAVSMSRLSANLSTPFNIQSQWSSRPREYGEGIFLSSDLFHQGKGKVDEQFYWSSGNGSQRLSPNPAAVDRPKNEKSRERLAKDLPSQE
eukprot:GFKZ01003483.1.p1 GENE.GFKZ01003483.1~~GFKZ01003483.1.p1  ORF type:complete len:811 (+),score=74.50 GFKZ01003483.1:409-2841(+)